MQVTKYERGTNEYLDAVYEETDGPLFIIQGTLGRLPVLAATEDEAVEKYFQESNGSEPVTV